MAHRLTRIYTRRGDDGSTALADGSRLPKDAPRIEALGCVDELNSLLGVLGVQAGFPAELQPLLREWQQRLFDLGGELALPESPLLRPAAVTELERLIDDWNGALPPLQEFILPGGTPAAAACHHARAVCRRCERRVLHLHRLEPGRVTPLALQFLNRLSDLLFVLARRLGRDQGGEERQWRGPA